MTRRTRMSVVTAALLCAQLATSVSAQSGSQDARRSASDIIVTGRAIIVKDASAATKSEAPIIETPQAISVVDAEFIDTLNVRTIAEALNYTAGVQSQYAGTDPRNDYYRIRGFNQSNYYKDGLVLYNGNIFSSWTTPAEGIERLEVLKGPSSVLYGGSSAGGLVNIVSKPPVASALFRAEVGADEYGTAYGSVDIGGPIGAGISARAVALVRGGGTQTDYAHDDRSYLMGSLKADLTPTTSLLLRGSYARDRSSEQTGYLPYVGSVVPLADGRRIPTTLFTSDPRIDRFDRDQYEGGYTLEQSFGDQLRFVSNGRYGALNLDYEYLYGQFFGNPVRSGSTYLLDRGHLQQFARVRSLAVDNRLEGNFSTGAIEHTVLLGYDYSQLRYRSAQALGSAPALDIFAPAYVAPIPALRPAAVTRQRLSQSGFYAQEQAKWGGFVVVLSGRHDDVGIRTSVNAGTPARGEPSRWSYRAGLVYVSPSGLAPYVSYATSFTPLVGTQAATGAFYRPETGRNVEAGLRYQARRLPLLATLSVFDIRRDGVLLSDPVAGFPSNQSQGGEQRSRGAEFEVQAQPLPTLSLTGSVTRFDIDVVSATAATIATIGRRPTSTAEFIISGFADYTLPSGPLRGLGGGFGVRHTGSTFADTINTLVVPSATILDLAVHYDWNRLQLALNVSNLADKAYVSECGAPGTCWVGSRRRATISLVYRR